MAKSKQCTPEMKIGRLNEAVQFLRASELISSSIDENSSIHLKTLLDMKGHSGYSEHEATPQIRLSAGISATELVKHAKLA